MVNLSSIVSSDNGALRSTFNQFRGFVRATLLATAATVAATSPADANLIEDELLIAGPYADSALDISNVEARVTFFDNSVDTAVDTVTDSTFGVFKDVISQVFVKIGSAPGITCDVGDSNVDAFGASTPFSPDFAVLNSQTLSGCGAVTRISFVLLDEVGTMLDGGKANNLRDTLTSLDAHTPLIGSILIEDNSGQRMFTTPFLEEVDKVTLRTQSTTMTGLSEASTLSMLAPGVIIMVAGAVGFRRTKPSKQVGDAQEGFEQNLSRELA